MMGYRNRYISALIVGLLCCLDLTASVRWLDTVYDFGSFRESKGAVTGRVFMVNEGPEDVYIKRVRPSCGCTEVGFSEGVIAPNDTAEVWFTYDPRRRPGRFEKNVRVYLSNSEEPQYIRLQGTVIGDDESLKPNYPVVAGPLRLSSDVVEAGKVKYGDVRQLFFYGYNQTEDSVRVKAVGMPHFLDFAFSSPVVAPGDIVTFSVYFNTRDGAEVGANNYSFDLLADGQEVAQIKFEAEVVSDLSMVSEGDLDKAPVCDVAEKIIDFGEVNDCGKKRNVEFTVKNPGKSDLHIRRVICPESSQLFNVKRLPTVLKPGASGKVSADFDCTTLNEGGFGVDIEIYSDDPLHPVCKVRLAGIKK